MHSTTLNQLLFLSNFYFNCVPSYWIRLCYTLELLTPLILLLLSHIRPEWRPRFSCFVCCIAYLIRQICINDFWLLSKVFTIKELHLLTISVWCTIFWKITTRTDGWAIRTWRIHVFAVPSETNNCHAVWPPRSPELNPRYYFVYG